jgi:hypothetical protein
MAKPAITKRVTKGSALTYSELDTNFQNLADATVSLTANTAGTQVTSDLNGNITLVAGTGISIAGNNTSKEITITNTSLGANSFSTISVNGTTNVVADTTSDTLTLNGATGVSISADTGTDTITISGTANFGEIQDGTAGRLSYYASGISGVAANKTLDDALIAYANTGTVQTLTSTNAFSLISSDTFDIDAAAEIDLTGSGTMTLTPGTNNSIILNTSGTGTVTVQGGILNTANVNNGGSGVIIDGGGTVGITNATNADIYITPVGTGRLIVANDVRVGQSAAGATIESNWNNTGSFLKLRARNNVSAGTINIGNTDITITGGSTTGRIFLEPQGASSEVAIGDGTNAPRITSRATTNLTINTNSGVNSGSIVINQGSNANIAITPNGTGKTVIGNLVATETLYDNGNSGTATITPNAANGATQKYTLTGNITWNAFGTPLAGQSMTMLLVQDGTGNRTLSSTMKFAGGSKTLSTAANAIDIVTVYYDGTNYYASLSKGFA